MNEEKKVGYVYMITSPSNRVYVGSTINIKSRLKEYKKENNKSQRKLYNSFKKYGFNNHKFEIVWEGNIDEMLKYETLIGWGFDVLERGNLNCMLPKLGDIYSIMNEETITKISKAKSKLKLTKEHKKNIGLSRIGKKHSKETRDKIRKTRTGQKRSKK